MGRLRRTTLFFFGTLFALAATTLLVVNLYVQSQGTQARIQQELSQRLGTPLHISGISVTPWGGLALSGITIPQISPATSRDFLSAKSFRLHIRILSLFSQRLIIKEVSLVSPDVVWPQNPDGKWRLPGTHIVDQAGSPVEENGAVAPSPGPIDTGAAGPTSPPPGTAASASLHAPTALPEKTAPVYHAFVPQVRRVNVIDGSFQFLDRAGTIVAAFEGVRFRSNVRNSQALRGNTSIAKISLRDRFFLQGLESPLRYDSDELELSKISARAGGGDVSGEFKLQPQSQDSPFTASVKFRGVQADEIVTEAGGPPGVIQGKLEGSFEASGKTADSTALTGKGEIFLQQGKLQQYSLLVALGQILQIEELTRLELEQAESKYHITPGLVTIDELILRSPNIRLSATGTVSFNGKLRLDSQLAINDKIRSQLFKPIRDNFQPIADAGYFAVNFQVGGTVDRPKTNLMDKVVGRDLKDFVSGLLGTKSDRKKKKKAADNEAAPPDPQTQPKPDGNLESRPAASATPP
ncbi:MAG: hypothetical protein QOG67_1814 [Verrucomicrobiota bacterium]